MSSRRRRKTPTRPTTRRTPANGRDFWGTNDTDESVDDITPSDDPATMITSLGPPPLPGHETAAQHYFDAVYEKAAALAVALAAANGVLSTDDPDDEPRA